MKKGLTAWIFAAFVAGVVHAETYECPDRVHLEKGTVSSNDIPVGFTAHLSSSPVLLTGAAIYGGPPEQGAELKPLNGDQPRGDPLWKFPPGSGHDVHLVCRYGDGTMQLVRKPSAAPSECVSIARRSGTPRLLRVRFVCR